MSTPKDLDEFLEAYEDVEHGDVVRELFDTRLLADLAVRWHVAPHAVQTRLVEIAERIKYGYPDDASYLRRLATGWGVES